MSMRAESAICRSDEDTAGYVLRVDGGSCRKRLPQRSLSHHEAARERAVSEELTRPAGEQDGRAARAEVQLVELVSQNVWLLPPLEGHWST
jgi:hypothetical protein